MEKFKNKKIIGIIAIGVILLLAITMLIMNLNKSSNKLLQTYEEVGVTQSQIIKLYENNIEISINLIENSEYKNEIVFSGTYTKVDNYMNWYIDNSKIITDFYGKRVINEKTYIQPKEMKCIATDNFFYSIDNEEDYGNISGLEAALLEEYVNENVWLATGKVFEENENLGTFSLYKMVAVSNFDLFVNKDESIDVVKDKISYLFASMTPHGFTELVSNANDVSSIKVGGNDFSTETEGVFNTTITYNTDKTLNLKIKVDLPNQDPLNQIFISQNINIISANYVQKGTELADWVNGKNIKFENEAEYSALTTDMVSGYDTSKEQSLFINITYKNITHNIFLKVFDEPKVESISISLNNSRVEQGNDFSFDLNKVYNNGDVGGDTLSSSSAQIINNYDKTKTGSQIVTFTIDGVSTQAIVYVYNEDNNPGFLIDNISSPIEIKDGAIVGQPTFKLMYMDGSESDAINITLDMLKDLDLEEAINGYYYIYYEDSNNTTFYGSVQVNFIA